MKSDSNKFEKAVRLCNASERMYSMLQCVYKKRLIPESWKNHYKDLEDLMKEIEGSTEKSNEHDGRMPVNSI